MDKIMRWLGVNKSLGICLASVAVVSWFLFRSTFDGVWQGIVMPLTGVIALALTHFLFYWLAWGGKVKLKIPDNWWQLSGLSAGLFYALFLGGETVTFCAEKANFLVYLIVVLLGGAMLAGMFNLLINAIYHRSLRANVFFGMRGWGPGMLAVLGATLSRADSLLGFFFGASFLMTAYAAFGNVLKDER